MSSQIGLRVVRGPDWKWVDQDGGEGFTGTVTNISQSGPSYRSVAVVWDSGFKGHYRAGPKMSYDLRIIDNPAGERHRNVTCGHAECSTKVIRGLRWKCVDCDLNLCTSCYMKKLPHEKDHNTFQRFDNPQVTDPETVSSQPEKRIKLMGTYPGAEVMKGPFWPYGREDKVKIGVVCSDLTEKLGEILVDWHSTKERSNERRCTPNGKLLIMVKEAAVAGFYSPECFPVLENSAGVEETPQPSLSVPSAVHQQFSLGDRVLVHPESNRKGVKKHLIGAVGTVVGFLENEVVVKFRTNKKRLDQEILTKINPFSVSDIIRIKYDEATKMEIEKAFESMANKEGKLEGSIGRVTGIDMEDASRVYMKFDRDFSWLDKDKSLPSSWMEKFQTIQPVFSREVDDWMAKGSSLFLTAIEIGDLRSAQLLFKKDNSVTEAVRNPDGKKALHIACIKGYKDIVCWLIDDAKIDTEMPDHDDFRPIHRAIQEGNVEILEMLLQRNVQLDVLTLSGKTPLHMAVKNRMTESVRLLIHRGSDVNVQTKDRINCTPLDTAIYCGTDSAIIQMLVCSGRINWEVKNAMGFNILHVAVIKNDYKAIQLILDNENQDLALAPFPNTQTTVLHYACTYRNFEVAKLLLEYRKGAVENPSVPSSSKLLEAKNIRGMTALLIAVSQRDYALIELLVGAGADVKAEDCNGDTALILAVTNPLEQDSNPPKDSLSPSLLKALEKNPALFFLGYLIEKGFCWMTPNSSGLKPADVLSNKGCSQEAIEQLNGLSVQMRISARRSSGGTVCMGQDECINPPTFQLTCLHRPAYKACSKCFMKSVEAAKCGCADEDISSIVLTAPSIKHEVIQLSDDDVAVKTEPVESEEDSSSSSEEEEAQRDDDEEEPTSFYSIRWFSDGSKNGYCKDDIGNKYFYRSTRTDGSVTYRCIEVSAGKRCPGVACKLGKKIVLESPHEHFSHEKKKKKKEGSSDGSPFAKRKKQE